jgi:hypothetical protein
MLSVIMLNVVMPIVAVPKCGISKYSKMLDFKKRMGKNQKNFMPQALEPVL